jgi:hypothetical protein
MKRLITAAVAALILTVPALAQHRPQGSGSRPSVAPSPTIRPSGGSSSPTIRPVSGGGSPTIRPVSGGGSSSGTLPQVRPSTVIPSGTSGTLPAVRPGSSGTSSGSGSTTGQALVRPGSGSSSNGSGSASTVSNKSQVRPGSSTASGGSQKSSSKFELTPDTNKGLLSAEGKVGPKTQDALNAALAGNLLTDDQRGYLLGALEKNKNLSPTEKAAIASALQNDRDTRRNLLAGGASIVVPPPVVIPTIVEPVPVIQDEIFSGASASTGAVQNASVQTASGSTFEVRHLRVVNRTQERLVVYVQAVGAEQPQRFTFEAGESAVLYSGEASKLATSQVWIWAESGSGSRFEKYKDNGLVLVEQPYTAEDIETFTFTFGS